MASRRTAPQQRAAPAVDARRAWRLPDKATRRAAAVPRTLTACALVCLGHELARFAVLTVDRVRTTCPVSLDVGTRAAPCGARQQQAGIRSISSSVSPVAPA